jgi:nucleotide-binding universal stress UspA family protein
MGTVLHVVDGTEGSRNVLSVHRAMVREPESIVVVHVRRPAGSPALRDVKMQMHIGGGQLREEGSDEILGLYEKELEKAGAMNIKTVVREGDPTEEILNVAREEEVDLIIMGENGLSLLRPFAKGGVFKAVERRTNVPVLIAKRSRREKSLALDWKEKNNHAA